MVYGAPRRRIGAKRQYTVGGPVAPFGTPLYPVPFQRRKRPQPGTPTTAQTARRVRPRVGLRVRNRGITGVQTRRKSVFGNSHKTGENSSVSATRFGLSMSPFIRNMYKKAQGRKTTTSVVTGSSISGQGTQLNLEWAALSRTMLDSIKAEAQGGTATATNVRLILGYVKQRLVVRNQSNNVAKCSFYDISWTKSPVTSTVDSVQEAWRKGYTDMGLVSQDLVVGNTPFNSPEFRRHCFVRRVTSVNMEPGQQHTHTVYRKVNRVVNSTAWDNGTTLNPVENMTSYILIVWHGSLGHENTSVQNVSYMPIRMDWAYHLEYNYGFLPYSTPSYTVNGTLPTIVNFDQMGETGDADLDDIHA